MAEPARSLPLLPLTSGVMLPGMVVTLPVDTAEAVATVEAAKSVGELLVVVPRIDGRLARVGVTSEIVERLQLPGGFPAITARGLSRSAIGQAEPGPDGDLWVQADPITEGPSTPDAVELARQYRAVLQNILASRGAGRLADQLRDITNPSQVADIAGYSPDLTLPQKVEVLETVDVVARLRLVLGWAREILADIALRERVRSEVEQGMEKTQRQFLLHRQLESIRRELEELDDHADAGDPASYQERFAQRQLPPNVRSAVDREIGKLQRTSEQSPEHGWIRTWLDTVAELPWGVTSEDRLDLEDAGRILDEDHDGLSEVKERILEHLAVRKLGHDRDLPRTGSRGAGAIVALVGPPGVGKTSLGESVARALGRSFVRVALGGVRDEAEIRGHRRTYVGSQPGRLVRALREAGTMNPVVLLDEVDKLGSDFRGDPASALLEVLDPAQNHTFTDHYLEVDLDLSEVLFMATANVTDTIPAALLDRMEIIGIDGYSDEEKVAIARHHLLGRQIARASLVPAEVVVTDGAIGKIVADYTREAGVRSLERHLGKVLRKVATQVAAGTATVPVEVGVDDVPAWLGRPRFSSEVADRITTPGVATGLAVTGAGGEVLFVEATQMAGPDTLTVTGQLGEVMKESATIALSYVRSHATQLGIDASAFTGQQFHLHVPAGAVPKDGPSAGVTMVTALVSLLRNQAVRPLAMTGEVTLRGKVLPIGGVRQKVLAAHRAGLREVVLPRGNAGDVEDVEDTIRAQMTVHLADDIADVLRAALGPAASPEAAGAGAAAAAGTDASDADPIADPISDTGDWIPDSPATAWPPEPVAA